MAHSAIVGSILGTAVGDAIGLPYEGMSKRRAFRLFGEPSRHRFFFGGGMVSDDTEHTCIVAQALIASGADPQKFAGQLGWRLRWWLLGMPAGIGKATLKATLKLWCGCSPQRSGVFSAGNGPAMRSAVLGAAIDDHGLLRSLVNVSTRVTHTDPKAEYGAWAVALAGRLARGHGRVEGSFYLAELLGSLPTGPASEFLKLVERAVNSVAADESTASFAESQGLAKGVSGYVYHTVPVAIHAWLRNQHDFQSRRHGSDSDAVATPIPRGPLWAASSVPPWARTVFRKRGSKGYTSGRGQSLG